MLFLIDGQISLVLLHKEHATRLTLNKFMEIKQFPCFYGKYKWKINIFCIEGLF